MFRALLLLAFLLPLQARGADLPPEVRELQKAFESMSGITDAAVDKTDVSGIPASDLGLLPYGDLPIGALRRTKGGMEHEVVVSVDFGITRDARGLKALEFVSWWVRDQARGGEPIQVRSLALPPIGKQFGTTLRFTVDYFHSDPDEDAGKLLAKIAELARGLETAKDIYEGVLADGDRTPTQERVDTRK
jgi:hypothetical protein